MKEHEITRIVPLLELQQDYDFTEELAEQTTWPDGDIHEHVARWAATKLNQTGHHA